MRSIHEFVFSILLGLLDIHVICILICLFGDPLIFYSWAYFRYLIPDLGPCTLKITYSAHTDLSVKFQSHRSRYIWLPTPVYQFLWCPKVVNARFLFLFPMECNFSYISVPWWFMIPPTLVLQGYYFFASPNKVFIMSFSLLCLTTVYWFRDYTNPLLPVAP